jgi:EAL domain-containing protein (putative c-di-GMP-specific phosphodiesterase class I)
MFVSASIGIALSSTGSTPENLLRNADTAMYQAKNNGKGRFEFFNEELRQRVDTRFETETGLRKAIDEGQLVLHYQPIVSDSNGRIHGFEALVRWNHPERGLIPPGEFIPVAEGSDLILLLGRWVLREACLQAAEWQRRFAPDPPLTVSVNVSSRQLSNPHLVEDVEGALKQAELKPECLALEMTESSIMGNAEQTLITLNRLKNMGVSLGIDDFGTGYSSLSYLQRLPFDTLKIDRSFVRELTAGKGSMDIVRAILELARSLKLEVIAEGVETEQQLCRLRKLGCPYYQGFLFSKPVDAAAAESLYGQTRDSGFFTLASEVRSPADFLRSPRIAAFVVGGSLRVCSRCSDKPSWLAMADATSGSPTIRPRTNDRHRSKVSSSVSSWISSLIRSVSARTWSISSASAALLNLISRRLRDHVMMPPIPVIAADMLTAAM